MPAALLATAWRGTAPEAVLRGHVVVVEADGTVVAGVGDVEAVTTVRSCIKPIQALSFVGTAADTLGVSTEEIAVACASHTGRPEHVAVINRLLARVGLDESALECGPQLPLDDEARDRVLISGTGARPITHTCSGKHAAMLATCVVAGWPVTGYAAWDHPLQRQIRARLAEFADKDVDSAPHGIDGCGLPTHGLPLASLARAIASATRDPMFGRCLDAMASHPVLVAGPQRLDTDLLTMAGNRFGCKTGWAAVWVAVRRPSGPALAIKLEAGDQAAIPAIAISALVALGWLDAASAASPQLSPHSHPTLHAWTGEVVGSIEVEPGWLADLRR